MTERTTGSTAPQFNDYHIARPFASLETSADGGVSGWIATPHGIVGVWQFARRTRAGAAALGTSFYVMVDGRLYTMHVAREYTPRGIKRVAGQFARRTATEAS